MNNVSHTHCALFVDDEEKAQKYFTRVFEKEYKILTASSVSEAKTLLDQHCDEIGVIVSDQRMPEENGVELLKYARKNYPRITRILTTAYSDLEDAIEAVNRGEILRYITKPWDINSLKTEMSQAMQFFLLKQERDGLVAEKLNVWQRMSGVNRLRDLVTMASGFTATCNASHAIKSLAEQLPLTSDSSGGSKQHFSAWENLQKEVEEISALASNSIEAIAPSLTGKKVTRFSLLESFKSAAQSAGCDNRIEYSDIDSSLEISGEASAVELLLASVFRWLSSLDSSTRIEVSSIAAAEKFSLKFSIANGKWGSASLSNIPLHLLVAFLLCSHTGGKIDTSVSDRFSMTIQLPSEFRETRLEVLDPSWIQDFLVRFENW